MADDFGARLARLEARAKEVESRLKRLERRRRDEQLADSSQPKADPPPR